MSQAIPTPFGCDQTCDGVSRVVTTPGPEGASGADGSNGTNGVNAFTTLTAGFTMPAVSATVAATVADNTWISIGQILFVENAGYMEVTGKASTTGLTLENLGYTGNASGGDPIANGGTVSPGGYAGVNGSNGTNGTDGINSYTVTTANFTMPAVSATVAGVLLEAGAWIGIGQTLYVQNAGYMKCTAKAGNNSITLQNLGVTGNAVATTVIPLGSTVSPSGPTGDPTGPAGGDLKGIYPDPLIGIGNALGSILAGNGTDTVEVTVGDDGEFLEADSGSPQGVRWGAPVPAGAIMPYAGATIPSGWLECLGTSLVRADYPALFTAIGTTWGAVDGTHFTLPDLRGRGLLGAGTGSGLTARTLGQTGGAEATTLITTDLPLIEPNSTITPAMAGANPPYKLHASQWDNVGPAYSMDGSDAVNPRGGTEGAPPAQTNVAIMDPFAVIKWMIKT